MVIGRGRRREHPMDTSEGVTWHSATTGVAQPEVAHAHPSHVATLLLLRKKSGGEKTGMRRTYFRTGPLPVISGQKALLWRIWCNFRLRMRRTYFRTGNVIGVTSGHVTDVTSVHAQWFDPPHDPPQLWLELYPYTTKVGVFWHKSSLIWSHD